MIHIRLARKEDIQNIMPLYTYAKKFMAANGNTSQWSGNYPASEDILKDIANGNYYVCTPDDEPDKIVGGFAFNRCDNLERVTFKSNKNWILICALDEPPREVGWLSYDCLSDNETAAKYLRDAFTHCVWTITDSVRKELINKNLDGGMDEDAYIDVSKFDFDNCNSDDYE